ncbi:MAG: DUF6172 family protein [Akkermansiaceae bacterium]|jgi:hypothetical protein|nr:DUF6172 family protein [Akkermansiaceae bacterium]
MRKSFPLAVEGLKPPRVVEAIKNEFRRYVKRERKKKLPEGVDFWDFDCRAGKDEGSADGVHLEEISAAVDKASSEGWESVFIEIVAKEGYRTRKPKAPHEPEETPPE